MAEWVRDGFFYHVFPLGCLGAPRENDLASPPVHRLSGLVPWLDQARALGAGAVLLGPVHESMSHGYDIVDHYQIDRRLGDGGSMANLCREARDRGLRVVLDGVFHHVGRAHWAFRDLLQHGWDSRFREWFHTDFSHGGPDGIPFSYANWNGHNNLVKLNLANPEVRGHLLEAAAAWVRDWDIDGLRLDAADHLDLDFMRDLSRSMKAMKPDFWLMGEVVHGDYRRWLDGGELDSVTNYEVYKGLWSSMNDANLFEIAYSLKREFGDHGLYKGRALYNFTDNHDVDRVATRLRDQAHLYPLYCLLFTIPGAPSVYYGSEFGLQGGKGPHDDWPLRPAWSLDFMRREGSHPDLAVTISRLAGIRSGSAALRRGDYRELAVESRRLAFWREYQGERVVVAVNASDDPKAMELNLPGVGEARLTDLLNPGETFRAKGGGVSLAPMHPHWARVLRVEG